MNFLILAAITAFVTFQQIAHAPGLPSAEASEPAPKVIKAEVPKTASGKIKLPEILEKIAFCESGGRQVDDKGRVIIGAINKSDIGKYQINKEYWLALAEDLGHDIYTEEGNLAMALVLYEKYGTAPWKSSEKCWK
ncbi:hypothetical protein HYT01_03295 [Candidatus Giovannonibacteria bacterium]|nr:hypothetical protein [Candidatus Giovannonibacteria bacterium]